MVMEKRSSVSIASVLKGARILTPHPWIITKLIRLQVEKWLFPYFTPRVDDGVANRVHQLSIRITDLCNLRCKTCGQWGENGFMHNRDLQEKKKEEVKPERYLEIFSELTKAGHHPNVYVWGGEPMMYKGLLEVLEGATRLGLPASIATNGHLLSRGAQDYVDMPLFLLQVSIDGHTEEMHNLARPSAGKENAFANVVSGLEEVKRQKQRKGKKLPAVASLTVVSRKNIKHLVDIYEKFREYVDIFVFYLSWWIDEEHAEAHDKDFAQRFGFIPRLHRSWVGSWRPTDYEIIAEQFKKLRHISRGIHSPAVTILPDLSNTEDLKKYYTSHTADFGYNECISIYQAMELHSDGAMSTCRDYHDYIVGNIKESSAVYLWNSPSYRTFRMSIRKQGLMPACRRCCGLMGY